MPAMTAEMTQISRGSPARNAATAQNVCQTVPKTVIQSDLAASARVNAVLTALSIRS